MNILPLRAIYNGATPEEALKKIADWSVSQAFGIATQSIESESSMTVREARRVCFFLLKRPWSESKKDRVSDRKIAKLYGYGYYYHSNVFRYVKQLNDLDETPTESALKSKLSQAKATYIKLCTQLTQTQTKESQNV